MRISLSQPVCAGKASCWGSVRNIGFETHPNQHIPYLEKIRGAEWIIHVREDSNNNFVSNESLMLKSRFTGHVI